MSVPSVLLPLPATTLPSTPPLTAPITVPLLAFFFTSLQTSTRLASAGTGAATRAVLARPNTAAAINLLRIRSLLGDPGPSPAPNPQGVAWVATRRVAHPGAGGH